MMVTADCRARGPDPRKSANLHLAILEGMR